MSISFYASGFFDDDDPYVNVSNSNGIMLMRNLGIEADYCGEIRPDDLLYKIATSDPIDSGTVNVVEQSPGHATMIDCGVPPGYMKMRYQELAEIARFAHDHNVNVIWS